MITFNKTNNPAVTESEMQEIYEKIKTPKKIGPVLKWENDFTDSATVFKYNGKYYMYFISISKDISTSGYETHVAESDNLIDWKFIGTALRRNEKNHWDSKQCAGYASFVNNVFGSEGELKKINGKYYIPYLAGNSDGYEPDPLYMGLAKTENPIYPDSFVRFEAPILSPHDSDSREYETKTLYKSFMFEDIIGASGHKYVNVYNAKDEIAKERIFLAVSDDAEHWERYGERAALDIITNDPENMNISGDPQIVLIGDIYVMLFFRYRSSPLISYNTFACSRDLQNWNVWAGEPLIKSTEPYENILAHKPWIICKDDIVYHYYCAVNDNNERFIALATSE